jgi:putative transposase
MAIDFQAFDPRGPVRVYRRSLPHWRQDGATYFVTARLYDSLPQPILQHLEILRRALARAPDVARAMPVGRQASSSCGRKLEACATGSAIDTDREYFKKMKHYLDQGHGACWLRDRAIAKMVRDAVFCFDGERYRAGEVAVLPNHVHVLVRPLAGHDLEKIMHSWKSFSAKEINKRFARTGPVWQHESFDRIVRDSMEFRKTERYIRNNLLPREQRDPGW